MKLQLLHSSLGEGGRASSRQHLSTIVIDDCVSLDAGSLGFAASDEQRKNIRDIVLTHAHLDHIAGLPFFLDDLFSDLEEPVRVHAIKPVIDVLEQHIFNWSVYPRFSELTNRFGAILEYHELKVGVTARVRHLDFVPLKVNHRVPSTGFIVSDVGSSIAISGDTAEMNGFWPAVNQRPNLSALIIECAFPNRLADLAKTSGHLTPRLLASELEKFGDQRCPIYVVNLKPSFREETKRELDALAVDRLRVLEVGRVYEF